MNRKLVVVVCVALTLAGCAAQQPHLTCKAPDVAPDAQRADAPAAPATGPGPEHPIRDKCRKIACMVTAPIWVPVVIFALARSGGFGPC
jgi:hypothetical protein